MVLIVHFGFILFRLFVIRLLLVSTNQRLLDVQHARSLAWKALRGRQLAFPWQRRHGVRVYQARLEQVDVGRRLASLGNYLLHGRLHLAAAYRLLIPAAFFTVMCCRQEQIVRIASSFLNFIFKVSSNPLVDIENISHCPSL